MRIWPKLLILLSISWSLTASTPLSAEDLPTVEELREHLRDYHKNFVTFRVRYRVEWPTVGITKYHGLLMTDIKNYIVTQEWFYPDKPASKFVSGGDPLVSFRAGYKLFDDKKGWELQSVKTERRSPGIIHSSMIFQPFYLLLKPNKGLWFDEYRFEHEIRVLGEETIDGEPCIKVEVNLKDEPRVNHETPVGEHIWFARDKGYLIKQVVPIKGKAYSGAHYFCHEYRQYKDHWYPFRGQIGLEPDDNKWEVVEFKINELLPVKTFMPPYE